MDRVVDNIGTILPHLGLIGLGIWLGVHSLSGDDDLEV